jgi:hypothetical protein
VSRSRAKWLRRSAGSSSNNGSGGAERGNSTFGATYVVISIGRFIELCG